MNKERYTVGRLPDNDIRIDNRGRQRPPLADHQHPQRLVPRGPEQHQRHLRQRQADQETCAAARRRHHRRPPPAALRRGRREAPRTNSRRRWSSSRRAPDGEEVAQAARAAEAAANERRSARSASAHGSADGPEGAPPLADATQEVDADAAPVAARQAAGAVRHIRRPRARASEGADDARSPRRAGGRDHAPRRRLLHRARRERQDRRLPARQRHADRSQARRLQRQRRHPARRREDGLLPEVRQRARTRLRRMLRRRGSRTS